MDIAELIACIALAFAAGIVIGVYVAWRKIHEEERTEAQYLHDFIHRHVKPLKKAQEEDDEE